MDFGITAGDTDKTIYVRLRDSTTGLAKTGLAYNSAGAVCSYVLPGAARAAITLATQTVTGTHTDGGFVEVDATNCKGLYRLDLPDAAIASGAYSLISIEFDDVIEETIIVPLSLRKSNVVQISGDSTAADNLEAAADGTGYNLGGGSVVAASVTGAVGSVTGGVTVTTNNDKTGYSLTNLTVQSSTTLATGTHNPQTGDAYSRLGAPAGASVSADIVAVKTDTGNLVTRIPAALFTGITSLAQWLGLIAGKQTGNTTARTELRATGAGSGTYDETTDSLEAVRDRGDSAWTTATGFSTHSASDVWGNGTRTLTSGANIALAKGTGVTGFNDLDAAGVRTAVGLGSANLDTQLGDIPTNSELATALGTADDAVLAAIASLNDVTAAEVATAVLTTAMTEAYRSTGGTATLAQFVYEVIAHLGNSGFSGTTKTLKKLDKSTTAKVFTIDDADTPTAIEETT